MSAIRFKKVMACAVSALLATATALSGAVQAPGGVPHSVWRHFTKGVNITRWFNYTGQDHPTQHFQNYMVPQDFLNFKELGIGYVRLCVGPQEIYRDGDYDHTNMPYIDKGVARLIRNGQAVIWDLHDNSTMGLSKSQTVRAGFVKFWQAVAQHYRGAFESNLVFELKNEPVFAKNPEVWYELQETTVKAIRAIDPSRTIMVSPTAWSGIEKLPDFKPLPETNLIYTVHCYDPFLFTHQGASWVGDPPSGLQHMPFPATETAVQGILSINEPKNKDSILWYGQQHFDDQYLLSRMKSAMDYSRKYHVPMVLGEFGSNPPKALPEDRARWFQGMRKAFDETKIPWCLWGYDDGMGLGRQIDANGKLILETTVEENLFRTKLGD